MPDEKGGLGGSVAIPGTKKKVPVILIIAVGGAIIAAYLILKGGGSNAGADVSAAPQDTGTTDTSGTMIGALTGAIEEISANVAALEEKIQNAATGASGPPGDVTAALPVAAVPAAKLPIADVTSGTTPEIASRIAQAIAQSHGDMSLASQMLAAGPPTSWPTVKLATVPTKTIVPTSSTPFSTPMVRYPQPDVTAQPVRLAPPNASALTPPKPAAGAKSSTPFSTPMVQRKTSGW